MSTRNLDDLVNYFVDQIQFDYENHSEEISILVKEAFYLRTSSTQNNMLIFKRSGNHILVDIIGSAGGTGLLNFSWGSEASFINKVMHLLKDYCSLNRIELETLND